jgi:hypothetical protein
MSLAWWSQKIDELTMSKGRAECGVDIWGRFAIAYQYEGLGTRSFYPRNSEIPESERIVIERWFTESDRIRFYGFVRECYEKHRTITIPIVEPLTVTVTPQVVEVFQPVWIEVRGTRGLADIEIYVDDQLIERYENQSIPQRGQYIPRIPGTYKIIVKHKATDEVAVASFVVLPKEKRVEIMPTPETTPTPAPTPTPQPQPPRPSPLPLEELARAPTPTPEITPAPATPAPANLIGLGLLGYILYEIFKKRR